MTNKLELNFNFEIKRSGNATRLFLRRLKKLNNIIATVGIHKKDGNKKVIRRYSTTSKKSGKSISHIAGKSHRMTIAKLAYQNEFGADILIKPKYKHKTIYSKRKSDKIGINKYQVTKLSQLMDDKKQCYVIFDKRGKVIKRFRAGSIIHIPPRPFLTRILRRPNPKTYSLISAVLKGILVDKKYNPLQGMKVIAKMVTHEVKLNVHRTPPRNNRITAKAKGHSNQLIDSQDRLYHSIHYKVYNNPYIRDSKGNINYSKQFDKHIDKLLKSIDVFDSTTRIFTKYATPKK